MTYALKSSSSVDLTPDLVTRFYTMTPSVTERPLNETRVNYLEHQVREGLAIPFIWVSALLGDKEFRVNGMHSSTALTRFNGELPADLKAHLDQYEISDLSDLPIIFRQYDSRRSSRTTDDVSNAYASVVDDLNGLPRKIIKLGIEAICWYQNKVAGLPAPKGDDRYAEFSNPAHFDFLKWLPTIYTVKTDELRLYYVVAAMYATYNVHPERANAFWKEVSLGGDRLNDGQPERVLDTWLVKQLDDKAFKVSAEQTYQGCIFGWNAHVAGKVLTKGINFDATKGYLHPMSPE